MDADALLCAEIVTVRVLRGVMDARGETDCVVVGAGDCVTESDGDAVSVGFDVGEVLTEGELVTETRGLRVDVRVPVVVRLIVEVFVALWVRVLDRVTVDDLVISRVRVDVGLPSSIGFDATAVGVDHAVLDSVGVVVVV